MLREFLRPILSGGAGFVAFLTIMPSGCIDIDGVPAWERCVSMIGVPLLFDWDVPHIFVLVGPLSLSVGVGWLVWWLLGKALRM
ncbi:hypothetical protein [Candidatus Spongiisocius sp.]|uniref:hypothetical protein n=1 Tax=Candidatus Spongiisocius sp. TaxID=3101273 RepID=UPI003B5CC284